MIQDRSPVLLNTRPFSIISLIQGPLFSLFHSMKVEISKDLEDLIPGYLEGIRKTIQDLKSFLEKEDWESLRVQGHRMKGSGGGYGFPFLTDKGKQIEDAAKVKDGTTVQKALMELDSYMESVEVVFVATEDW